jgi:hypothetical protein
MNYSFKSSETSANGATNSPPASERNILNDYLLLFYSITSLDKRAVAFSKTAQECPATGLATTVTVSNHPFTYSALCAADFRQ